MQKDSNRPAFRKLGHGLGLRNEYWNRILEEKPDVDWFEIISENLMDTEGKPMRVLEKIRETYPIICHGVALSIGSADPLDLNYLNNLKKLVERFQPAWFSDHLCWTGINQTNSHDLLPMLQTESTIAHIVERVDQVQNFIKQPMLLENVSSYVSFKQSDVPEWEFISEIARRSGCGILLDINNVYVNAFNHGFDAKTYIEAIPKNFVGQFHLAGHTNKKTYLFDTHSARMTEPVWELYKQAVLRFGAIPTLVEWDDDMPEFEVLMDERRRAMEIEKNVLA